MTKLNKSLDRGQFGKTRFVKRLQENPDDEHAKTMIDFLDNWNSETLLHEQTDEWKQDNLEYDLRTSPAIQEKCKDKNYAQNLYAAMCNNQFIKNEVMPILTEQTWTCSWRSAGGIVADIREEGDYIDWYCSGIRHFDDEELTQYVHESHVTEEIKTDLFNLGWLVVQNED